MLAHAHATIKFNTHYLLVNSVNRNVTMVQIISPLLTAPTFTLYTNTSPYVTLVLFNKSTIATGSATLQRELVKIIHSMIKSYFGSIASPGRLGKAICTSISEMTAGSILEQAIIGPSGVWTATDRPRTILYNQPLQYAIDNIH